MLDCEHQAGSLNCLDLLAVHIVQVLHHKMRATLLDLLARVARAYGNNDDPRRDASLDPARRIFKDDAVRGTVAEALGGEEEWVRRGLSHAQAWVIRHDRYFGRDDAHSRKTVMRCSRHEYKRFVFRTSAQSRLKPQGQGGWGRGSAPCVFAPDVPTA